MQLFPTRCLFNEIRIWKNVVINTFFVWICELKYTESGFPLTPYPPPPKKTPVFVTTEGVVADYCLALGFQLSPLRSGDLQPRLVLRVVYRTELASGALLSGLSHLLCLWERDQGSF